jgi:hypothetical protein
MAPLAFTSAEKCVSKLCREPCLYDQLPVIAATVAAISTCNAEIGPEGTEGVVGGCFFQIEAAFIRGRNSEVALRCHLGIPSVDFLSRSDLSLIFIYE